MALQTGVSLLLDCTCSIKFGGADLGGGETLGSTVSFLADKVSYKKSIKTADHSPGQAGTEFNRVTKYGFEVTVETKLYPNGASATFTLLAGLNTNDVAQLTVSAPTGSGLVAQGTITGLEPDYAGPSTLKFSLNARGAIPAFA